MKLAVNLDMGNNQILNFVVQGAASDPGTGFAGQMYYNTASNVLKVCTNATGPVWVALGTSGGSVTTVSVVSANGFAGSVATATTTPAITVSTTITGLLKGNGTAISAASAGTDYLAPAGNGSALTGLTESQITNLVTDLAAKAPLASPAITGTPTAPTAGAGTNTTQLATTAFVTAAVAAAIQGLVLKGSAVAATVGTETFTIVSGSVTVINGTTLDGASPAVNDLVLVKDAPASSGTGSVNSTQPGNGLYIVTNATTNLTISRTTNMSGTNAPAGSFVFVEGGTQANNGYTVSVPSTNAAFTYGTNNIKWQQFSGAGEITAGTGLSKSGNTLNVSLVPVAQGGTNQTTAQAAINALLGGTMTAGLFARANGTNFVAAALQAADVPNNAAVAPASVPSLTKFALIYNSASIGDGSATTLTVTHNLNNVAPNVMVYDVSGGAGNFVWVICDVKATSANAVTLTFAVAPASSSIQCVVVG